MSTMMFYLYYVDLYNNMSMDEYYVDLYNNMSMDEYHDVPLPLQQYNGWVPYVDLYNNMSMDEYHDVLPLLCRSLQQYVNGWVPWCFTFTM